MDRAASEAVSDADAPGGGPVVSHSALAEGLRSGDDRWLGWAFHRYRPGLLRYARRLVGDLAQPEDIVQEAFLRLWKRREDIRSDGSVRALLFISVRCIARDEFRRWGRRMVAAPEEGELKAPGTPLDDLLYGEVCRTLESALEGLSPRRRQVVEMVRGQGLTHEEAARALGVTRRTVKNTMSSALSKLRESMEEVA